MSRNCKLMTPTKNIVASKFQDKNQKKDWKKKEENERSMISLCAREKQDLWNIDIGCSKHMRGDPTKFIKLKDNKGRVTFGDNMSSKIIGKGTIVINSNIKEENVLLV